MVLDYKRTKSEAKVNDDESADVKSDSVVVKVNASSERRCYF